MTLSVLHTKATSFVEAASSLARALYACDCDATLKTEKLLLLSRAAASCGRSHVLIWAQAVDSFKWLEWHQQLCMAAVAGSQLATLQELRTSNPEQQWEVVKVAAKAAECADLSMLQWILEHGFVWTVDSVREVTTGKGAARAPDAIDKMTLLCQRAPTPTLCPPLRFAFAVAIVEYGTVASLKWLASSGFRFDNANYVL
jgi:hypothetical protein